MTIYHRAEINCCPSNPLIAFQSTVTFDGTDYYSYLRDYQGNIRCVVRPAGRTDFEMVQQNHYYPYGLPMSCSTSPDANPIRNIDPTGEIIQTIIDDVTYTWTQIGDKWNFVDPEGNEYKGDNDFVSYLTEDLTTLMKGPAGNKLVTYLANHEKIVDIKKSSDGKNRTGSPDTNQGITSVEYNPLNPEGGLDATGSTNRPPFVALGHEFSHVEDHFDGTTDNRVWFSGVDSNGKPYTVCMDDIKAINIENLIRFEHGFPARISYTYIKIGSFYTPHFKSMVPFNRKFL